MCVVCVCMSVCLLDTTVSRTEIDKLIKMMFGFWAWVHPRNHVNVLCWGLDPPGEVTILGMTCPLVIKYRVSLWWAIENADPIDMWFEMKTCLQGTAHHGQCTIVSCNVLVCFYDNIARITPSARWSDFFCCSSGKILWNSKTVHNRHVHGTYLHVHWQLL